MMRKKERGTFTLLTTAIFSNSFLYCWGSKELENPGCTNKNNVDLSLEELSVMCINI